MTGFRIRIEEDTIKESERFTLIDSNGDETCLAYTNHDEDGYHGMSSVRDVISILAFKLGIEMFIQEPPEV